MLQPLSLQARKTPKSLLWDNFRRGVNRQGDPSEISQNHDQQNAVMDLYGMKKREGSTKKGATIGAVKATGLKQVIVKGAQYFFAVCAQVLKKWNNTTPDSDWSNTDKTALTTTLNTHIKSFTFVDGSALDSGTADAGGTSRLLIDAAKSWTVDAYAGCVVSITSGTGSGQKKLITANEATKLYVNEPFDTVPDATSGYSIYNIDDLAVVANGTEAVFKYNGTASSNLTTPGVFDDIEVHDKRLWGFVGDGCYFSDESVGDQFSQNSYVPFANGDGDILRAEALNEQLVVYKANSFAIISGENGSYGIKQRSGTIGLFAPNSLATGAEMQFFLSRRGVELVNRFESDVTAAILPISENIQPWLDGHSDAEKVLAAGGVFENFYYLCIPSGVYTPAYLTGDTGAQSTAATWAAVTNGSFRITLNGSAYNIDGINFTGCATMAAVAAVIQTAIRAMTGSTETCVWSTNKFVITSANTSFTSAITVLSTSTGTVGTDISGAGAADWMDADTGNGTATAAVLASTVYYTYRYDILASNFNSADPRKQVWDRFKGLPASCFAVLNGQLCFGSYPVSSNTYVYTAFSGDSDDGAAIDLILETEDSDFGLPDVDKEVDKIHIFAEASAANITYTIEYRLNAASTWTTLGTVNTKTGLDSNRKATLDLYSRCRTLAVRVTRSDTLAAAEGRIIKILAHYHLDTRE